MNGRQRLVISLHWHQSTPISNNTNTIRTNTRTYPEKNERNSHSFYKLQPKQFNWNAKKTARLFFSCVLFSWNLFVRLPDFNRLQCLSSVHQNECNQNHHYTSANIWHLRLIYTIQIENKAKSGTINKIKLNRSGILCSSKKRTEWCETKQRQQLRHCIDQNQQKLPAFQLFRSVLSVSNQNVKPFDKVFPLL